MQSGTWKVGTVGEKGGVGPWLAAWVLVVLVMPGTGCDRSQSDGSAGGEGAQEESGPSSAGEAEEASGTGDAGGKAEASQADWKSKVEQALEKGKKEVARERAEEAAKTCSFFPDSCEEGRACFSTAEGKHRCAVFDPNKRPGDVCRSSNGCDRRQQCVGGRPGRCLPICNPDADKGPGCASGRTCVVVYARDGQKMPWGACQRIEDRCTRWPEDSCGIGENCYRTPVGLRCQRYNREARVGTRCERDPTRCNFGQACVEVGDSGWRCMDKCDDSHPCEVGECRPIREQSYGFCGGGDREEGLPRRQDRVQRDGSNLKGWSD